jgi:hypothetical protein
VYRKKDMKYRCLAFPNNSSGITTSKNSTGEFYMGMGEIEIIGISMSDEGAKYRPSSQIETSILDLTAKTKGKIFLGVRAVETGSFTLGIEVNGESVPFAGKEKLAQANIKSRDKVKVYPVELPMRIFGREEQKFPADHVVKILWGHTVDEKVQWVSDKTFTVRITGISPQV